MKIAHINTASFYKSNLCFDIYFWLVILVCSERWDGAILASWIAEYLPMDKSVLLPSMHDRWAWGLQLGGGQTNFGKTGSGCWTPREEQTSPVLGGIWGGVKGKIL